MKPLPTSPRIPADPAGKTRLHGSSSPLFPANPLDNEHGSCGVGRASCRVSIQRPSARCSVVVWRTQLASLCRRVVQLSWMPAAAKRCRTRWIAWYAKTATNRCARMRSRLLW